MPATTTPPTQAHRDPRSLTILVAATVLSLCTVLLPAAASATGSPADHPNGTAGLKYVALGDSYSSGFGLTPLTGAPVPGCAQSSSDFPHQVAARLSMDLTDVSCAGATTNNVLGEPQVTADGTAPAQISALSPDTDVVTITVGGNDIGFAGIAATCLATSPLGPLVLHPESSNCATLLGGSIEVNDDVAAVPLAIVSTIAQVRIAAPNAKVFIVEYPTIAPDLAHTPLGGCFTPAFGDNTTEAEENAFPFTVLDVPFLHAVEGTLNAVLDSVATGTGATLVPTFAASADHSACAGDDAYINGITVIDSATNPPTVAPGALHPNAVGTAFLADRVGESIAKAFPATVTPEPNTSPASAAPSVAPAAVMATPTPTTTPAIAAARSLGATGSEPGVPLAMGVILMASGALLLAFISVKTARRRRTERS
jgi:lysophospholipase L1-like esterase